MGEVDIPMNSGWIVVRPGKGPQPDRVKTITGPDGSPALEYRVERDGPEALASPLPLNGFTTVSFKMWSQYKTIAAARLEDKDGATFHAPIPLEANRWTKVNLSPASFEINDDSPVRKQTLSSQDMTKPFSLIELGKVVGLTKPNVLRLANMKIEYGSSGTKVLRVPALIDGYKHVFIKTSGTIDHDIVVRNYGTLIISAPSVHLDGNLTLDHGYLEVRGCNFYVDPKFEHQFTFTAKDQSTIIFDDCQYASPFPTQLNLLNSELEIKHVMFPSHGFTCSAEQSTVNIDDAVKPGEFIVQPGSHFFVNKSHGVALWLTFGPEAKANLTLPAAGENKINMTIPASTKLDLKLTDSNWILWAMLTKPGCYITLRNSELMACGMMFPSKTVTHISDLRDDRPNPNFKLNLSDRNVTLVNSRVKAWNFYPLQDGNLAIAGCTFGELNAFNRARVNAFNSSCDALGGYVRISDEAQAELTNCILNCSVVTTDRGHLILNHCTVAGDTTASGDSSIVLNDTKLNGHKQEVGHGHIASKP